MCPLHTFCYSVLSNRGKANSFAVALAVACRDVDVRNVKAIIIGPPDTPYEFGFFEVSWRLWRSMESANACLVLSQVRQGYGMVTLKVKGWFANWALEYPGKAPAVLATTTNGGRCRFNPNIYAGGKVCLWVVSQAVLVMRLTNMRLGQFSGNNRLHLHK